jgi:uncharacterized protein YueI
MFNILENKKKISIKKCKRKENRLIIKHTIIGSSAVFYMQLAKQNMMYVLKCHLKG